MGIWDEMRSRLFGEGPDEPKSDGAPAEEADAPVPVPGEIGAWQHEVTSRQERAAGRILDDERLRSDLTDDESQPLLDWALTVTDRVAAGTADVGDEQAQAQIDDAVGTLREVLRAASDAIVAHNEGRAEDRRWALDAISQTWRPSLVGGDEGDLPATLWQPLQRLADRLDAEPDLSGPEVAAAIVAALALPAEHESTEPQSATAGPDEPAEEAASERSEERP